MPEAIAIFEPIEDVQSLKDRTYDALKQAITTMDIYASPDEPRLDERLLSEQLGVSRTPIREAIARLEQEGLVRIVPRRGVFVVRKPKREILQMITVWAALESMAARLITLHATDAEIASLRTLFATPDGEPRAGQYRRIFRPQYPFSPGAAADEPLRPADRNGEQPVHPHAGDPRKDDFGE